MSDISKSKILVVDDDRQLLREIKVHLEKQGYIVGIAEDGLAALALARTMSPNLVVLDINFPEIKAAKRGQIDGIEVLRRLRDLGNTPILMLSATNISSVKVMALTIGADD